MDFCLNGGAGNIDELAAAGAAAIGEIFSYEHSDEVLAENPGRGGACRNAGQPSCRGRVDHKREDCSTIGRHDAEVYSQARPAAAEAAAIEKALGWSDHLHICHLSSAQGLERVAKAKMNGRKVTSEVAPHHLLLNIKDYKKQGSYLKMNPPLRSQADNDALWQGLRCGTIDILASDHAPHLPEEKKEDIWEAPAGVPGVETMLPLMLFAVKRNMISLERLVDAMTLRPARIFGLAGKGSIEKGKDADLVIVDPRSISQINADRLHSRAEWTPFQGRDAIFPQMTIIRGNVVYDGDLPVSPGYGRFLGKPRTRQKVL